MIIEFEVLIKAVHGKRTFFHGVDFAGYVDKGKEPVICQDGERVEVKNFVRKMVVRNGRWYLEV